MNTFFRYSGTKAPFVNTINSVIRHTTKNIYVEPFAGSGSVLFNLTKKFDEYIISDVDRNIIRIYKTFSQISYKDYLDEVTFIENKFGSMKVDRHQGTDLQNEKAKKSYYSFRDWFNKNYWNTDTVKEGIYLQFLANSCINSFLRFGPNGMNQSYGLRFYTIDSNTFQNIKDVLVKTKILNLDYKEVLSEYKNTAFYFFDPPYYVQSSSYDGFSYSNAKEFINLIEDKEYVYTDILNELNSGLKGTELRKMRSTSPSSSKGYTENAEYLFTSVDCKLFSQSKLFWLNPIYILMNLWYNIFNKE